MTKRFNIIYLTTALCAVVAVTAAYGHSSVSKTSKIQVCSAISKTVPMSSKLACQKSSRDRYSEENDDEKDTPDPSKATLTSAQAGAAALAAYPGGKVTGNPSFEDEDGVVVYGVSVTAADGKKYDVKVDANTGKVLKSDADDSDSDGDGDSNNGQNDGQEDK